MDIGLSFWAATLWLSGAVMGVGFTMLFLSGKPPTTPEN